MLSSSRLTQEDRAERSLSWVQLLMSTQPSSTLLPMPWRLVSLSMSRSSTRIRALAFERQARSKMGTLARRTSSSFRQLFSLDRLAVRGSPSRLRFKLLRLAGPNPDRSASAVPYRFMNTVLSCGHSLRGEKSSTGPW